MTGGSTGRDAYPDGWNVTARRLNNNGTYNTDGETINFFMTGSFINMIKEVNIVRKMVEKRTLKFE